MRSCSSSRPRRAFLVVAVCGLMSHTCALDLDFDSLSNECSSPAFDIPGLDHYCSGELTQSATFSPPALAGPETRRSFVLVDVEEDLVATAGIGARVDDGDEGCTRITIGLSLGQIEESGGITPLGSINGFDYGLDFAVSEDGSSCADATATFVWPTELEILDTSPIHVLAAFGDAGLISVHFDARGNVQSLHHVAGAAGAPTGRRCLANACVTVTGQYCDHHADCAAGSYCDPNLGCRESDACTVDRQCEASGLLCATRRGSCTAPCASHFDCPHPHVCVDGVCGGVGCNTEVACLGTATACFDGVCQPTCSATRSCPDNLLCVTSATGQGMCSPGGRAGLCTSDDDCWLGIATGFTVLPASPATAGAKALIVTTADRGARLAILGVNGDPYFIPTDVDTGGDVETPEDVLDALYVPEHQAVYLAVASYGIIRMDVGEITSLTDLDENEVFTGYPLDLAGTFLAGLIRVGNYLVTIEGGLLTFEDPNSRARILQLAADPTEDLASVALIELGETIRPTVSELAVVEGVWLWAVDRPLGSELLFYDMRQPENPSLLTTLPLGPVSNAEAREWATAFGDEVYVGTDRGLTPFVLSIEGELE